MGMEGEHGVGGSDEGGVEGGEEVGFPGGDGVGGGEIEVGEGGGGGVDGVNKVPDGGGANAAKGGDDPLGFLVNSDTGHSEDREPFVSGVGQQSRAGDIRTVVSEVEVG